MSKTEHPTRGTNMDAATFDSEQKHLQEVYSTLSHLGVQLAHKIEQARIQAAQDKEDMAGEIAPNFATDTDAFETYTEYATANNLIGAYNVAQDANLERLTRINTLLKQPYFAKILVQFKETADPKELYLGTAGATDENYKRLVVDWRSPVAEVYYNQDLGQTSYVANGKTINVDLKLRRQFDIERNVLHSYFDTNIAIQDALLLQSLSSERSIQMQSITATIQKEQNKVIRYDEVPALLVSGVAGSGKTSVLLQRIAYLFYQNRKHLHSNEVCLVSPNNVFSKYIEQVLPSLGEENPDTITWDEFAKSLLPFGRSLRSNTNSAHELYEVDKAMANFAFDEGDIKDIVVDGTRLISAKQIIALMKKFPNVEQGPHLVTLVREELFDKLNSRLSQLAASEKIQDELIVLPLNEQVDLFNGPYDPQSDEEAASLARIYLNKRFAAAIEAIENDEWLRIDRIGMRMLGKENLESSTWLYLKCAVTGMSNASIKYVIIDEVQDYSIDQLAVLAQYFTRAKFMMLGDEYQAIQENTASFQQIQEIFSYLRGRVDRCELLTSYRSTPRITELFCKLLPESAQGKIQSIQRADDEPRIVAYNNEADYTEALINAIESAQAKGGICALIVPWKSELRKLEQILGNSMPQIIDGRRFMPSSGIVALTLPQAKGLEFDQVIIPNASETLFPGGSNVARNRLYTSISRANKGITILSLGDMTSLLKH